MALDSINVQAAVTWEQSRPVAGFANVTQGSDTANFALSALDTATWDALFAAQYTIAASGTQAVDLRTFTDLPGNSVTADKVLTILILVAGATADRLNVKPHGTDGLQWFFGGATESVNVPGGGCLMFSEGAASAGTTVSATARQLLLTNTGGAALTVKVVALTSDT